ncbi:MAG: F0F1 ATP synthase subunit alpha [Anaerolineae bacterium]|nr:F0F1 ATP synthase subunit alpha [Anaerolineae bacterium]
MSQANNPLQTSDALADFQALAQDYRYEVQAQELEASLHTDAYVSRLDKLIQERHFGVETKKVGIVQHIGDGITLVSGLQEAMVDELLLFSNDVYGMALSLEEQTIGCVLLGREEGISAGDLVQSTGRVVEVPVGPAMVGRVVNALGQPIDGRGPIETDRYRPIENTAPMVIDRQPVQEPLQTGIKTIDAVIPLGRGQRELIIGDRQIGKTAIAVDAVINQRHSNVRCIYVCIGQKMSAVARMVNTLRQNGAMEYTTVIVASADEPAVMLYLAPYAGCAMAEEIMYEGGHALVVYDDLSKQAMAYRELSLLLRRPPGREAYPGDIFYLHSRLLERSGKLNSTLGGGSITALPIVETQAGNMAAYIPTNLISITDGQIYLSPSLFQQDIKPAIDVGLSVSRVGGAAQSRAMRAVSRHLKLDISQYLELQIFARFGTELDPDTRQKLERGQRVRQVLRQTQHQPQPLAQQVAIIYAVSEGLLDNLPIEQVRNFEQYLFEYMEAHHKALMNELERGQWPRTVRDELLPAVQNCMAAFQNSQVGES